MDDAWISEHRPKLGDVWAPAPAPAPPSRREGIILVNLMKIAIIMWWGLIRAGSGPRVLLQEPIRNIYTQTHTHTQCDPVGIYIPLCAQRGVVVPLVLLMRNLALTL